MRDRQKIVVLVLFASHCFMRPQTDDRDQLFLARFSKFIGIFRIVSVCTCLENDSSKRHAHFLDASQIVISGIDVLYGFLDRIRKRDSLLKFPVFRIIVLKFHVRTHNLTVIIQIMRI